MRKFAAIMAILALTGAVATAQARATLFIQCNQSGAQVYLDGRIAGNTAPSLTLQIQPGNHQLVVKKNGFQDYSDNVVVPAQGKSITVTLVALGAAPPPVPTPPPVASTYPLTVTAPGPIAKVYINGQDKGLTPLTIQLPPGSYEVKVLAGGMLPWSQQVQIVNGPASVMAGMQAQTFALQVGAANAPGATIFLNGSQVGQGSYSAALQPGTYTVIVRAPGFLDYSETFNLQGPKTINAALQQQTFSLQVSVPNAPGAAILLNGAQVGQGGYNASLQPGTYTVVVRAPGFNDYTETFSLQGPKTIAVNLQQVLASYTLTIPPALLAPDPKGNPHNQIQVYVDNIRINVSPAGTYTGSVSPGRHQIRIVAGGLKFEQSVDLQAGKAWTIEPSFNLILR